MNFLNEILSMSAKTLRKVNFQSTAKLTVNPISIAALQGGDSGRTEVQPSLAPEEQRRTYVAVLGERKTLRMKLMYILSGEVNGKAVVKYQSSDVIPEINL
ncbi:hypothetical protein LIER_33164 [Lithospermum erythrorhizon]|uniref:Uncharacterized protein n=1 Tax=Lithospermum erythrorhizon TaxID=34254 RepID=A0AAV3S1K9_LITER